jgi:hypothetical protein
MMLVALSVILLCGADATNAKIDPPKDCSTLGSQTNCTALDPKAYCGESAVKAAQFADGSGCSCDYGLIYDTKTHHCVKGVAPTPAPAVPTPAPPGPAPKNCSTIGSKTSCIALDPEAYCGESDVKAAQFDDGTGCSCKFGYNYDKTSHHCVKTAILTE